MRILQDTAAPGVVNMARDEALMTLVGRAASPPTLRLYEWSEPTISLGYFQRFTDLRALSGAPAKMPVVRRQTGGGAILHDRELTYSLSLPMDHPLAGRGPNRLYELVHDALIRCLQDHSVQATYCGETDDSGPSKGPFYCFARRHRLDLLIGADKVAGSAQRRTREAVLQHGSIIVQRRFEQQPAAALAPLGVNVWQLRKGLPAALATVAGMIVEDGSWTAQELELADELAEKYADDAWTKRR